MGIKTELQNNNVDLKKILKMLGYVSSEPEADTLDGCSWANISKIAASGNASNYFAVGDCKKITLNGTVGTLSLSNFETYVYIIGFDHNGATGTIDFGTFKTAASDGLDVVLVDSAYGTYPTKGTLNFNMHHWGYNNYGGWAGCDMRYDILGSTDTAPSGYGANAVSGRTGYDASPTCATNPVSNTLMAALPSELRAVMKPMTVYTDNIGNGSGDVETNITATIDYLPLLGGYEMFEKASYIYYANTYEKNYQMQYAYFVAGNATIKYKYNDTSSAQNYFLRSPNKSDYSRFCIVTSSGSNNNNNCASLGLAPIFRV